MSTATVCYLIVVLYEWELSWLQELSLGDIQAVFTVQELDHGSVAVSHCQIILNNQTLQMLYDTSAEDTACGRTEEMRNKVKKEGGGYRF